MKPFLAGKKSANGSTVHSPHPPGKRASAGCAETGMGEPSVELVKEGDKIVRLIVTCMCGERTEIDCMYPPGKTV